METLLINHAQQAQNVQVLQTLNEQLRAAVEQKDEKIQALEHQLFGEQPEKSSGRHAG